MSRYMVLWAVFCLQRTHIFHTSFAWKSWNNLIFIYKCLYQIWGTLISCLTYFRKHDETWLYWFLMLFHPIYHWLNMNYIGSTYPSWWGLRRWPNIGSSSVFKGAWWSGTHCKYYQHKEADNDVPMMGQRIRHWLSYVLDASHPDGCWRVVTWSLLTAIPNHSVMEWCFITPDFTSLIHSAIQVQTG